METPLEPTIRRRPGHAPPAAGLSLVLTFWSLVDGRFSPEIFQTQLATGCIGPMQPIQEWLARSHHDSRSVDGDHSVAPPDRVLLRQPADNLETSEALARLLEEHQVVQEIASITERRAERLRRPR